ncbi:nuclear transport factor 2 family protein [Polyangium aurulentum]|uniref:nuclear transport factor 2 family protein n=1 Tax=Polyangium aurulentum TaxID=2567896 RepID=UPI0010AE20A4|nr:nuclear transport factor 2 family protein [Polyangium aurulentum]UQA57670.1 nuclear transport factor 2 family protein [Polyangium aurulentum]
MTTSRTVEEKNQEIATSYLRALEGGAVGAELEAFFHEDAVIHVLPNRIAPQGQLRDRATAVADAAKGKKLLRAQRYAVRSSIAKGDTVALEVEWTGTLAVGFGSLQEGHELRAHIAIFLELRDGRIVSQRNYDCYEPW